MNQEDLLNAIGMVDDRMLEKSEKKPKPQQWKWITGVVAACLVLLMVLPFAGPGYTPAYHTVADNPLQWKPKTDLRNAMVGTQSIDESSAFKSGITVEAKVARLLPDRYYVFGSNSWYRILELSVENVIVGNNVPDVIYCRVTDYITDADINQYDTVIFGILQIGVEGCYPMLNERTNTVERFGTMFACAYPSIAVFKNGVIDAGIEDSNVWRHLTHCCKGDSWCIKDHPDYPFKAGATLQQVRDAIKELAQTKTVYAKRQTVITLDTLMNAEVRKAFDYVQSTDGNSFFACNGIVAGSGALGVAFIRYIDGYQTNEAVAIDFTSKEVQYMGEQFTAEDVQNAENVQNAFNIISAMDPENMAPPAYPTVSDGHERLFNSSSANYKKINGKVYCVITLNWRDDFEDGTVGSLSAECIKIIMPDGTIVDYDGNEKINDYLAGL